MASGHRHHTVRLARLITRPPDSRAGRRQLRKLLGRAWGLEWRALGNTRRRDGSRAGPSDALTELIVTRARTEGHVLQRLRSQS